MDLSRLDEQTPDYDWGFQASTQAGRPAELSYSRARILGGCANHNDCAFLRPPDSDFADWERLGAKGWGANEMAPYFERILEQVTVEEAPRHPASRAFVEAGKALGLPEVDFRRELKPGVGWFPLNAKGKIRQSSSIAYLHPLAALPRHLEIWIETIATKLILEEGRAVGAETSRGIVRARRAVILAAGAIQTPQLMMVSGLGPADHLQAFGIAPLRDLPGVGGHLLDHVAAPIVWDTHAPIAPWEICPFEATLLLKIEEAAPAPDILFHFGLRVREKYGLHPRLAFDGPAVKASPNVTRARSQGRLRLGSADFRAPPIIDLNYFSDPYDLRLLIAAMRFARRLGETPAFRRLVKSEVRPGLAVASDGDWESYIRDVCETVYHPCGTCAMGDPAEPRIVCGPDLKVKGVDGLFIADASLFPSMITTNINFAVMAVAERAADLIAGAT
jgi:choline oxidase